MFTLTTPIMTTPGGVTVVISVTMLDCHGNTKQYDTSFGFAFVAHTPAIVLSVFPARIWSITANALSVQMENLASTSKEDFSVDIGGTVTSVDSVEVTSTAGVYEIKSTSPNTLQTGVVSLIVTNAVSGLSNTIDVTVADSTIPSVTYMSLSALSRVATSQLALGVANVAESVDITSLSVDVCGVTVTPAGQRDSTEIMVNIDIPACSNAPLCVTAMSLELKTGSGASLVTTQLSLPLPLVTVSPSHVFIAGGDIISVKVPATFATAFKLNHHSLHHDRYGVTL